MYEMCVKLPKARPFLVHCQMDMGSAKLGTSSTVVDIVETWTNILAKFEDPYIILFIDSYYHSQGVHNLLVNRGVKYAGASTQNSFSNLCQVLESKVHTKGTYAMAWKHETEELFVHFFSPDDRLGRKFVLTTAYQLERGRLPRNKQKHIPGFDLYTQGFNICDEFNKKLSNTAFPHKSGGHTHHGQEGQEHKYMLAVLLQNIFAMYDAMHENAQLPHSNEERCSLLAKELYEHSFNV